MGVGLGGEWVFCSCLCFCVCFYHSRDAVGVKAKVPIGFIAGLWPISWSMRAGG